MNYVIGIQFYRNLCLKNVLQYNKLENIIFTLIKHTGPLTVFNFMREILTNTTHGYYMKRDVFGQNGDFITSPEISQMFGELCGIWILNEWIVQNKPQQLQIVELGPGRGTLMIDAIKALSKFPDLLTKISVSFVEISPSLKLIQENTMQDCAVRIGFDIPVNWFDNLQKIPRGVPSMFLAHEFFDALPIHRFKKNSNGKWREILVDLIKGDNEDMELGFVLSNNETAATIAFGDILERNAHLNDVEISPISAEIIEEIGDRITESGGFALIADYGHCGEKGDTFRAFKGHKVTDPLQDLGEADLTADVDFKFLTDTLMARFSRQLNVHGPICQRDFLENMGIGTRLQMLLRGCKSEAEANHLISGYNIMMSSNEMGQRFKFLSILPRAKTYPTNYVPAGFCAL